LEYWSIGVLEYWSIGVLEYWSIGVLEYWSDGISLSASFRPLSQGVSNSRAACGKIEADEFSPGAPHLFNRDDHLARRDDRDGFCRFIIGCECEERQQGKGERERQECDGG
jgi:hypothetical protein